jgi:hypothetical protein
MLIPSSRESIEISGFSAQEADQNVPRALLLLLQRVLLARDYHPVLAHLTGLG